MLYKCIPDTKGITPIPKTKKTCWERSLFHSILFTASFFLFGYDSLAIKYSASSADNEILQYQGPVDNGDVTQKILRIKLNVVAGGGVVPKVSSMTFALTGFAQMSTITLYTTNQTATFTSPVLLKAVTPAASVTFSNFLAADTIDNAAGNHYYWLLFDAVNPVTANLKIDASYTTGSYASATPAFSPTDPSGFRWTSRTYQIGSTASEQYATLKAAADAIVQFDYDGATDVFMELTNNYASTAETGVITFATHTGPATITFRPASGVTGRITAYAPAATFAFITFNGASKIKFDGRSGGTGTTIEWTIQNTQTDGTTIQTFHFLNDASNNTLTYLNIEGDANNAAGNNGMIHFGTTTGSTGNDNNTISYCKIRNYSTTTTLPNIGIYSYGTASYENSGNIIDNCEIYDFWGNTAAGENNAYIFLSSNSTGWTITNNHFYKTSGSTFGNFADNAGFIVIGSGGGYTITGNYMGGQGRYCSGGSFSVSSTTAAAAAFFGIYATANVSGSSITISNNVISNISVTSAYNGADFGFQAIRASNTDGTVSYTIGSSGNGNRIGATSGTDSLVFTHNGSAGIGISGIDFRGTGTANISYNTFGSISLKGSRAGATTAMINATAGSPTISNNTVGGSATAQNIRAETNSTLSGIYTTAGATITNNTVQQLYNNTTGTAHYTEGIRHTTGAYTCTGNTVKNGSTTSQIAGTAFYGIVSSSTTTGQTISSNIVQDNAVATTAATVTHNRGIYVSGAGSGGSLKKNFVTGLTNTSTSTSAQIGGMLIDAGGWDTHNNVVVLSNSANTNPVIIRGIEDNSTGTETVYHNTIKITGAPNASAVSTAAFRKSSTSTCTVRNNIFQNLRTGSPHRAYDAANTTGLTSDYNYLEVDPTEASNIGNWGGTDYNFANWQSQGGANNDNDKNSTQTISATGYPSGAPDWTYNAFFRANYGYDLFTGSIVTDDKEATARDDKPWMGAFEGLAPLPIELLTFTATAGSKGVNLDWTTASETGNDYFTILRSQNSIDFEKVLTVKGAGYSSTLNTYSALDTDPYEGVSYYRLKQTDYDGTSALSNIVSILYSNARNTVVETYPNPVREPYFTFNIASPQSRQLEVILYDLAGKELYTRTWNLKDDETSKQALIPVETLSKGVYLFTVKDGLNTWNRKVVVY